MTTQTVLITGGTGLVGSRLTALLIEKGYQVSHLSRSKKEGINPKTYQWDIKKKSIEEEAIAKADYIIHLAGASVADKRWTSSRKKEILNSRIESAALLRDKLKTVQNNVKALISASAIGIYGIDTGSRINTEEAPKGNDFLADVAKHWEAAADDIAMQVPQIRIVKLRIGIVLSDKGGALEKMMQPIRLGAGAPLGSGKQYMSWIHIDDLCRMFIHAIENDNIKGVYNAVAPHSVTNEELTRQAAKLINRPVLGLHVPAFALKLVLGEMAETVLGGSIISADKIKQTGFNYRYAHLNDALSNLLK
jgi:uncharacterized protein (TIGR01777 family)